MNVDALAASTKIETSLSSTLTVDEPVEIKKKAFWCHATCGSYHDKCYWDEPPAKPWAR